MTGPSEPLGPLKLNKSGLDAHKRAVSAVLQRRLQARGKDLFQLREEQGRSGTLSLYLQANRHTRGVSSDRDETEQAGLLATRPSGDLLCSFFEVWGIAAEFEFRSLALRFYLQPRGKLASDARQIFRLEWEDKTQTRNGIPVFPAPGAAYPHWQFDRWLTASDRDSVDQLRRLLLAKAPTQPQEFGSPTGAPAMSQRPDLKWFTRLHFPVIAPWYEQPIIDMSLEDQPHRWRLTKPEQVVDWLDSSLRYVVHQFETYA